MHQAWLERFSAGDSRELLQQNVEGGAMDDLIRKRIKSKLYVMAGQDKVKYEPSCGWKLTLRIRKTSVQGVGLCGRKLDLSPPLLHGVS
jgi:hypothetical protein